MPISENFSSHFSTLKDPRKENHTKILEGAQQTMNIQTKRANEQGFADTTPTKSVGVLVRATKA